VKDRKKWEEIDVQPPYFDLEKVEEKTKKSPKWIHFGVGNIFRGFVAAVLQNLLESGREDTGINAVELFDYEIIDKVYKPYDNLTIAVTIKPNGSFEKRIIASIMEVLKGDPAHPDWKRVKENFCSSTLQLASFTITEKGYNLEDQAGNLYPQVVEDMKNGPSSPRTSMGKVVALLYERFKAGKLPIAMLSLDNFSRNGEKLYGSVRRIAEEWVKNGLVEEDFLSYLDERVSFPWSMIDKIVPGPSELVKGHLERLGVEGLEMFITSKKTHIAPFVNMEWSQYLVIEENFPNGRPEFERADRNLFLATRETVERAERMKVTACLNPLHTALAVFGCLLGYKKIADEMKDPALKKLVEGVGEEGIRVVVDPGIIKPREFLEEVINVRLPNPYLPDTPQRIATDTSQKVSVRFGETIKAYCERSDLNPRELKYIPLVIAGWCRYLMGINDEGKEITLSPDPLLESLRSYISNINFGSLKSVGNNLKPILSSSQLFKVNLYEVGLGEKIEEYFKKMIDGPGAVRKTLEEVVGR